MYLHVSLCICVCICVSAVGVILCERSGQASRPVKWKTGWTDVGTLFTCLIECWFCCSSVSHAASRKTEPAQREQDCTFPLPWGLGWCGALREPRFLLCKFRDPACPAGEGMEWSGTVDGWQWGETPGGCPPFLYACSNHPFPRKQEQYFHHIFVVIPLCKCEQMFIEWSYILHH